MRKTLLALAGAALAVGASSAQADVVVTFDKTTVGAKDIYRFFAQNNGANGTGTKLLAVSATIVADSNALMFKIADADLDGVDDADVNMRTLGVAPTAAQLASSGGSYVRFGAPASFLIGGNLPEGYSDANGDGITDPGGDTRAAFFQNTKTFRVDGFNGSGGITTTTPVQFAAAVVPAGTTGVGAFGTVSGESGPTQDFNTIPEPTALGLLGIGAVGLLSRRRRQA